MSYSIYIKLLAGLALIAGVFTILAGDVIRNILRHRRMSQFQRIRGKIVRSERTAVKVRDIAVDTFEIEYEFDYFGKKTGNTPILGGKLYAAAMKDELLERYHCGDEVDVIIDPTKPNFSCLELAPIASLYKKLLWFSLTSCVAVSIFIPLLFSFLHSEYY